MSKSKLRIGLFFGGTSAERKVSLISARSMVASLDRQKYDITPIEVDTSGRWFKKALKPIDVALLALHGPGGEDGTIQGMLELLGVPYTCSGVLASALGMDKFRTKRLVSAGGVPVLPDVLLRKGDKLPRFHKGGLAIKPNKMGSSLGVTIVKDQKHFKKALADAFKYDDELLIEPYIAGPEITVAVLGNRDATALPTIEIVPWKKSTFYDYEAKYEEGGSEHVIPARVSPAQQKEVQRLAVLAHEMIGGRGVTRSDFILAKNGQFYFLEINTIPGMTPTSLVPQAAAAAGISFPQLLDRLIKLAREK